MIKAVNFNSGQWVLTQKSQTLHDEAPLSLSLVVSFVREKKKNTYFYLRLRLFFLRFVEKASNVQTTLNSTR